MDNNGEKTFFCIVFIYFVKGTLINEMKTFNSINLFNPQGVVVQPSTGIIFVSDGGNYEADTNFIVWMTSNLTYIAHHTNDERLKGTRQLIFDKEGEHLLISSIAEGAIVIYSVNGFFSLISSRYFLIFVSKGDSLTWERSIGEEIFLSEYRLYSPQVLFFRLFFFFL